MKCRWVLTLIGLGFMAGTAPSHAEETVLPAQCYVAPITEGIPVSYARESIIDQPILEKRVEPTYPEEESKARPFYCAAFSYSIDAEGKPVKIETLYDSHPGIEGITFGETSKKSLEQWRYQPGMVDKGGVEFLGFTVVFFKGFGEVVARHAALAAEAEGLPSSDHVAKSWRSYGKTVTQEELEQLEMAADQKVAPAMIAKAVAAKPKKKRAKIANSWIVGEDGSVLVGDKVYRPGDVFEGAAPASTSASTSSLPTSLQVPTLSKAPFVGADPDPNPDPDLEPELETEGDKAFPPLVE